MLEFVGNRSAPATGPRKATRQDEPRRVLILSAFPEVKQVVPRSPRHGRRHRHGGIINTEYSFDLKPKNQWRPLSRGKDDDSREGQAN